MGGYSHPANKDGTPIQLGRYPHQGWMRYPSFRLDGVPLWLGLDGIPHPTPSEQDEVPLPISTGWGYTLLPKTEQQSKHCYSAGGMPLAFTQEDFLTCVKVRNIKCWARISPMYISICGQMIKHGRDHIWRGRHLPHM